MIRSNEQKRLTRERKALLKSGGAGRRMSKTKHVLRMSSVTAAGFLLGMSIWWASPRVTGHAEPWDADNYYYSLSLISAGFVAAMAYPKCFWLAPIGVYFGQFAYAFLFLPVGPLWVLGLLLGAFYCLLALLGAAAAFGISRMVRAGGTVRVGG